MAQPVRGDWFAAILWALITVAVIRLWVQPLGNSFWLDETLTAWIVSDGFSKVIPQAFVSLQSVAFCVLEWFAAQVAGHSEAALRLLPLAAAIATAYVLYRIGLEAFDRELGLILAALFVALPSVAFEVSTARPYAAALLAHTAALLWLLRWLRSGRLRDAVWWAVCAALACHFHLLFAAEVPIEAGLALWRGRGGVRQVAACALLLAMLLMPAVPQAVAMRKLGSLLSFAPKPPVWPLLATIAPMGLLILVTVLAALTRMAGGAPRWKRPGAGADAALVGAALLLIPATVFFALARVTQIRLFEGRYLLPAAPGLVLLWGWLLRGLEPARLRHVSLGAAVIVAVLWTAGFSRGVEYRHENWRSAARSMPDTGAVLVYTGLVETRRLDWVESRGRQGYLAAPVAVYRPSISPDRTFPLPFEPGPSEEAYVERLFAGRLAGEQTITIIARRAFYGPDWISWLSGRLAASGFEAAGGHVYGTVEVRAFRRADAAGGMERAPAGAPGVELNLVESWISCDLFGGIQEAADGGKVVQPVPAANNGISTRSGRSAKRFRPAPRTSSRGATQLW